MSEEFDDDVLDHLDQKSRDILQALAELDESIETVQTPDLMEATGIDRPQLHYRLNEYLEPFGLVDTHQPAGQPGSVPPKEMWLTDAGKALVAELESQTHTGDIGDRLNRLEGQVDSLQSTVQDLQTSSEEPMEASSGDLDNLQNQVANLAMELEELKDDLLFQEDFRRELDAIRIGSLAMRDYLVEKFDDDELEQLADQYRDEIDLLTDET